MRSKIDNRTTHIPLSLRPGLSNGRRTAWILSFTPVAKEPRVIRQASALEQDGWRVVVVGFASNEECPSGWHFFELCKQYEYSWLMRRLLGISRRIGNALIRYAPINSLKQLGAKLFHRAVPEYRWAAQIANKALSSHPELTPDLVISHDYYSADAGWQLAQKANAKFSIDCHEYARGQYMNDPIWVRNMRPYVIALQDYFLARADAVTTVSKGIAQLLNQEQELKRPVTTIRSMPRYVRQPMKTCGSPIIVLYHGVISPIRGLDLAVKSMKHWRKEFHFLLRGDIQPEYREHLYAIANEVGVADRFCIEPRVSFDEIIPTANQADIGYFVHEDTSPQKRFVLPNKFFEYVMAGLALCTSNLPEMAALIRRYEMGFLVEKFDEVSIANCINSYDRESINTMKQRALDAANDLNWEMEQSRLLELYARLVP